MSDTKKYVFVLWGDGFDEATATTFVTELREVGLPVKIVSLTAHQPKGKRGVALVSDLTLDQALPLAAHARCIIIPADARWENRYSQDPRFSDLCLQANGHQATFVVGKNHPSEKLFLNPQEYNNILIYPPKKEILAFAQGLAAQLLQKNGIGQRDKAGQ